MNNFTRPLVAVLCAVSMLCAPMGALAHESAGARVTDEVRNHLVDEAMPAIYHVTLRGQMFDTATGAAKSAIVNIGSGTGFGVTRNGLVLTKMHVVNPSFGEIASKISAPNTFEYVNGARVKVYISLTTKSGTVYDATIVGGSPTDVTDVALLQITGENLNLPILVLSDRAPRYDAVITIGNPFNIAYSVGEGIVSNPDRVTGGRHFIQTTALVAPGSSGGPIIRLRDHEVIGMIDSTFVANGAIVDLGFGTPSTELRRFLKTELTRLSAVGK